MENLLIMGINTRPMVNSALRLNYNTYSVSYFKTYDFNMPYAERHVLNQESVESCGFFEENYHPHKLLELSKDFLYLNESENKNKDEKNKNKDAENKNKDTENKNKDAENKNKDIENKNKDAENKNKDTENKNKDAENKNKDTENKNYNKEDIESQIDKIVLITGIHADDFKGEFYKFKKKIRGNLKTDLVDDKFKFYKKIKNKFDLPLTIIPNDISELKEILKQYDNNQFILKPLKGNGGLGIYLLNYDSLNELNHIENQLQNINLNDYILQEHINGTSISSSVLASQYDRINIFNSRLISENDFGHDNYAYSGNIVPLDLDSFNSFNKFPINNDSFDFNELNEEMKIVSESIIKEFGLIGSNGVDFILDSDGNLKVIEVNPRLQGTYELCEEIMDLNLLDAHIKACEGELIDVPEFNGKRAMKKIIYSTRQVKIGNLSLSNVYDVPYEGVKIESFQPIVTLINSAFNLNKVISNIKNAEEAVYKNIE